MFVWRTSNQIIWPNVWNSNPFCRWKLHHNHNSSTHSENLTCVLVHQVTFHTSTGSASCLRSAGSWTASKIWSRGDEITCSIFADGVILCDSFWEEALHCGVSFDYVVIWGGSYGVVIGLLMVKWASLWPRNHNIFIDIPKIFRPYI